MIKSISVPYKLFLFLGVSLWKLSAFGDLLSFPASKTIQTSLRPLPFETHPSPSPKERFLRLYPEKITALQNIHQTDPILLPNNIIIHAKNFHFQDQNILIALEPVIQFENYWIFTESLTYLEKEQIIFINSPTTILFETGEVLATESVSLDISNKTFHFGATQAKLIKSGYLSIKSGTWDPKKFSFSEFQYTSCFCDPDKIPLWSLRAESLIIDHTEQIAKYSNVKLYFKELPISYLPHLKHPLPDPNKPNRLSGFLFPSYVSSSYYGSAYSQELFFAPTAHQNILLKGIFTTKQNIIYEGLYETRFKKGDLSFFGSTTIDKKKQHRWYINSAFDYSFTPNTHFTGYIQESSDDTYVRIYEYDLNVLKNFKSDPLIRDAQPWRRSHFMLNNLQPLSSFSISFDRLTDIRTQALPAHTPISLPSLSYKNYFFSDKGKFNIHLQSQTFLYHQQKDNPLYTNIQASWNWEKHIAPSLWGEFNFGAHLQGDLFINKTQASPPPKSSLPFEDKTNDISVKLSALWKFPLIRHTPTSTSILEPTVSILSSYQNTRFIAPLPFRTHHMELNTVNLFLSDPIYSDTYVESGTRINYGLQWKISDFQNNSLKFIAGNSFFIANGNNPGYIASIVPLNSIYITGITANINNYLYATYKAHIEPSLTIPKQQLSISAGPPVFKILLNYNKAIYHHHYSHEKKIIELSPGFKTLFSQSWTADVSLTFSNASSMLPESSSNFSLAQADFRAAYNMDCLMIVFHLKKNNFSDRDLTKNTSFMVDFSIKPFLDTTD